MARQLESIAIEIERTADRFKCEYSDLQGVLKYFRFNVSDGLGDIGLYEYQKIDNISGITDDYLQ